MSFLVADRDYYQPWDSAEPGQLYQAGPFPPTWRSAVSGTWQHWAPAGGRMPDQGWKVHVSSSFENAQPVLAVVSGVCADLNIGFKHLTGRRMFLLMHDKHASRVQAGKFCTLYPESEEQARQALHRLHDALAGLSGPYVLTDRRFGSSQCVSYRYGAFRTRMRVDADGIRVHTMTGPDGQELDDDRVPEFRLPPGLVDPFRQQPGKGAATGPVAFHGYTYETVIQHSNAGGAYRFRTGDGASVFLKEARAHNGYTPDGVDSHGRLTAEYLLLRALHQREPGLAPRPVELFEQWEHSYLVTELVPGIPLYRWMVFHNPYLRTEALTAEVADYHRRCLAVLDQLDAQLRRLHELGFVFLDLSPTNILVDDDDRVRLVDFEAVQPVADIRRIMGTPGYQPPDPRSLAERDPREIDRYGLAALALLLVFPVLDQAERNPHTLTHLHADLSEVAPVEPRLWAWATRYRDRTGPSGLPTPAAVRDDPLDSLRLLAERTADALEAMAQPERPGPVYPTNPLGYQTDSRNLAAGTAGVLHALHRAGRACDPVIVGRLRDEALAAAGSSAPGLLFGSSGVAGVLAELGEGEAAEVLLTAAAANPLNRSIATFGAGAAGTSFALLRQHVRTGDQRWLVLAQQVAEQIPDGHELTAHLSGTRRSGLVGGRAGVALTLYHLHRLTGDQAIFDRGLRLLRDELVYAQPVPVDAMGFKTSHDDRRVYPYLFAGSAGYAAVLSRYLALRPDADFDGGSDLTATEVLECCLRACTIRFAALPGLFPGLSGLVFVLADLGRRLHRPELVEAARTSARGLFRYAIPWQGGIGWLGEPGQRLSADLWSGSAGVLLALRQALAAGPDLLDTLDPPPGGPRCPTAQPESAERRDQHGGSPALAD